LDSDNESQLLSLIQHLNQDRGTTFVLITHDEQVASIANRTVTLKDGYLLNANKKGGILAHETH
jgi:acetoin utilization transport system ATP-binding protein